MRNQITKHLYKENFKFCRKYTSKSYKNEERNFIVQSFFHHSIDNKSNAVMSKILGVKPISCDLKTNILHNPNNNSKFKHIEVTEEHIRLEFSEINGMKSSLSNSLSLKYLFDIRRI